MVLNNKSLDDDDADDDNIDDDDDDGNDDYDDDELIMNDDQITLKWLLLSTDLIFIFFYHPRVLQSPPILQALVSMWAGPAGSITSSFSCTMETTWTTSKVGTPPSYQFVLMNSRRSSVQKNITTTISINKYKVNIVNK